MYVNRARHAVVAVAERGAIGINSLLGLLPLALFDLFLQIFDVVLGDGHVNVVHEFVLRAGIFRNDSALFYEVHLNTVVFDQFLNREAIGAIPVKPVGFLDKHDAAIRTGFEHAQHVAEFLASRILRRFHVHEFLCDLETAKLGVFGAELALCGDR